MNRWTSPDPAELIDGPNVYAYVGGNPVVYMDILGLVCINTLLEAMNLALKIPSMDDVKFALLKKCLLKDCRVTLEPTTCCKEMSIDSCDCACDCFNEAGLFTETSIGVSSCKNTCRSGQKSSIASCGSTNGISWGFGVGDLYLLVMLIFAIYIKDKISNKKRYHILRNRIRKK